MSRFLTPLRVEKIGYDGDGRALYRVLGDLVYESDRFGMRIVREGFVTNFASVPRLPVVFLVAGGRAEEEATLHDYEYTQRWMRREECDQMFLESLQAEKPYADSFKKATPKWLAWLMYAGVRLGGGGAYEADSRIKQPEHIEDQMLGPT